MTTKPALGAPNPRERLVLATGAIVIAVVAITVFSGIASVFCCGLGWTMLAIAAIDRRHFIIPDRLSLPAIPAGLVAAALIQQDQLPALNVPALAVLDHAIAALGASLALYLLRAYYLHTRGHEGLGLGDVKLIAAGGAWTGVAGVPMVLLLAAVAALVLTGVQWLAGDRSLAATTRVPFGAYLAPSIWLVWLALLLDLLPIG